MSGAAAFQIINQSTAGGSHALRLTVPDGKSPLVVNATAGKALNLNADKVDGFSANDIVRSAFSFNQTSFPFISFTEQVSVTLDVTQPGFVLLTGAGYADTSNPACDPCYVHFRFRDVTTGNVSASIVGSLGDANSQTHTAAVAPTWRFPATPGSRTYVLETAVFPESAAITPRNTAITALFVPFGADGLSTVESATATRGVAQAVRDLGYGSRGAR